MNNQLDPDSDSYSVDAVVEIFDLDDPWIYVRVPPEHTADLEELADRGLVPVSVSLGETVWATSLMPMGDGTQFIPLNARVRAREAVEVGDRVKLSFVPRAR